MCRFLAYKGATITLDKLLFEPNNSLVHQSYHALERGDPVNGDGFGVGWFIPGVENRPAVYVDTTPAWNNRNLRYNAEIMRTECVFAHVRSAEMDDHSSVTDDNCHPFHYDRFLMMHNGHIADFGKIKRDLCNRLSLARYQWIKGQTDSEHFFALFLDHLFSQRDANNPQSVANALRAAIMEIDMLLHSHAVAEQSPLNLAVTNGDFIVATRFTLGAASEQATLYYSAGGRFECANGVCQMVQSDPSEHAVLVVSERLTNVDRDWNLVPMSHFVVVNEALSVSTMSIEI